MIQPKETLSAVVEPWCEAFRTNMILQDMTAISSLERGELKHGLFSYYLLEAPQGKADANQDGRVSIRELYDYVYDGVSRHSKQVGGSQHPILRGETSGQIFL